MKNTYIDVELLYQNNHVDLVHDACKLCYNGKPEPSMERKLKYIEDKVKVGHESVIEHSNIIMGIELPAGDTASLFEMTEVLSASKYLNSTVRPYGGSIYYILSGSIRAFKAIYKNMLGDINHVATLIMNELYKTPKEYYYDFIQAGIVDPKRFNDMVVIEMYMKSKTMKNDENVTISGMDCMNDVIYKVNKFTEFNEVFNVDDLLDHCTITVFFDNISRILSQMITRHRNGISQKSQRYVDETGAVALNPLAFTDYVDKDTKFDIHAFKEELTIDEINARLVTIYDNLRTQGLKKEDSRFLLPQGVETSLYVTFTVRNYIHFLSLRTHKSTQHEIRKYAEIMYKYLAEEYSFLLGEDIYKYLIPKYMLSEIDYNMNEFVDGIDEILEVETEEV